MIVIWWLVDGWLTGWTHGKLNITGWLVGGWLMVNWWFARMVSWWLIMHDSCEHPSRIAVTTASDPWHGTSQPVGEVSTLPWHRFSCRFAGHESPVDVYCRVVRRCVKISKQCNLPPRKKRSLRCSFICDCWCLKTYLSHPVHFWWWNIKSSQRLTTLRCCWFSATPTVE